MVKSLGKKGLAMLLALCLLLSLLPAPTAHAASYEVQNLKENDSLVSGDTIVKGTGSLGSFAYYDAEGSWIFFENASGRDSYIIQAPYGITDWKIKSIEQHGGEYALVFCEVPKPTYAVTVIDGSTDKEKYPEGEMVTITARKAQEGEKFVNWTADGEDVALDDANATTTTFTMPARGVTVTANFREVPKPTYGVTVIDGSADKEKYTEGELVTITTTEKDGAVFTGWESADKGVAFKDAKALSTTFTMPGHGVTVKATFKPVEQPYEITAGANGSHQAASGKDLVITCSGPLEDLTGIFVDGKLVDPANYGLKSGSTILTLKAGYLDTLSVGKHTLRFEYKNQSVETNFTILAKDEPVKPVKPTENPTKPTNPGTGIMGDTGEAGVFSLIVLSALLMGAVAVGRKARQQ